MLIIICSFNSLKKDTGRDGRRSTLASQVQEMN